jgi:hypothetical protein
MVNEDEVFRAITQLAYASDSADKELSILSEALNAALVALSGNENAFSDIAQVVTDEIENSLDDNAYLECESDFDILNRLIKLDLAKSDCV